MRCGLSFRQSQIYNAILMNAASILPVMCWRQAGTWIVSKVSADFLQSEQKIQMFEIQTSFHQFWFVLLLCDPQKEAWLMSLRGCGYAHEGDVASSSISLNVVFVKDLSVGLYKSVLKML